MSSDFNIVEMNSIEKHATAINQMDKQCISGIKAETTVPLKEPHNPTGTMSLVSNWETPSLHLSTSVMSMCISLKR